MQIIRDYISSLFNDSWSEHLVSLIGTIASIAIWLLIGFIISSIMKVFLNRLIKKRKRELIKREKTVWTLVISVVRYLFWFYIWMMVFKELGFDIMPLLASAGIVAFAVGFGAQEMIKDFISGFFIIVEHAFDIGDVIQIGDFKGRVLEIGLRRTKIINARNEVRIINNGDIRQFTNYSLDTSVGEVNVIIPMSIDASIFESNEFNQLLLSFDKIPDVLSTPVLIGVVDSNAISQTCRITFNAQTNKHHAIERLLRKKVLTFIREHKKSLYQD